MPKDETPLYIGNRWLPASGAPFTSLNPATGTSIWSGQEASSDEIEQAIAAARKAFPEWAALSVEARIDAVRRFAVYLEADAHRDAFAETLSLEVGKPLWESLTEVAAMRSKVPFSIEAYETRRAPVELEKAGLRSATRFKPHGVCAVLGPFNLPGHLPNAHIIPALIAGNTVVFKPSHKTPLCGRKLAEAWQACELPPGVFNMVQGQLAVGKALVESTQIDGVFFTGGFPGGRALSQSCAPHPGKILALELGGNNPLIVWDPCDLDAAVYHSIQSALITSGQRCTCARRLIVPESEFGARFVDRLVEVSSTLKVGPYSADDSFYGPVISAEAAQSLLQAQQQLQENGASTLLELKRVEDGPGAEGKALLTPGILDVTAVAARKDEEYFGPLLQVIRVPDFASALAEANATSFGLSAGLLCQDRERFESFYEQARAGIVNWNRPITGASGSQPFGGCGNSGNHRPSGYYAADYCSYPVASTESETLSLPEKHSPGIIL